MNFKLELIEAPTKLKKIKESAEQSHIDFTKAVIDIRNEVLVIGSELHADEEEFLLRKGSEQKDLWGINLYPEMFETEDFIEFDSMINIRPAQGNRSRDVENESIKKKIVDIVCKLVKKD